ncbi:MAG: MoxR family ATPase [Paenibacillaceae bacterium]|nr:MoxR family ATPase [Paenibacillaceae bacterium]
MELSHIREAADRIKQNIAEVIVGKEAVVDQLLIALISSGHVLLEDVPGTGKTLLAKTLAASLDCSMKRIQFTPDLLPSDLSGIHFYNQRTNEFTFRQGPLFANVIVADEINRATPRTQSSLLECMEERQVTVDGETMPLEQPFLVIATQNPVENQGTFPLPEAQLDRFLLKVKMGYPSTGEGLEIMRRFKESSPLAQVASVIRKSDVVAMQRNYSRVRVSDDLLRYMLQIVEATRAHDDIALGVSPRGSQALLRAVQVQALLQGREYVIPDDVKSLAAPVLAHRLLLRNAVRRAAGDAEQLLARIVGGIAVPAEELQRS